MNVERQAARAGEAEAVTTEWHRIEPAGTATRLESDVTRGIGDAEAAARLDRFGANVPEERVSRSPWRLLWDQVSSTLVVVLLVAASISFAAGILKDAITILAIVVLNAVLGFIQEYRAERAIAALRRLAVPKVRGVPRISNFAAGQNCARRRRTLHPKDKNGPRRIAGRRVGLYLSHAGSQRRFRPGLLDMERRMPETCGGITRSTGWWCPTSIGGRSSFGDPPPLEVARAFVNEGIGATDVRERTEAGSRWHEWRAPPGTFRAGPAGDRLQHLRPADCGTARRWSIACSPGWERVLGWTPEELRRRSLAEQIHPDHLAEARAALEALRREGTPGRLENRHLHRDGTYRWLRWNAVRLPGQDRICAFGQDITAQKEAEEALKQNERRLSLAVAASGVAIWELDLATDGVYHSPQWYEMLGYQKGEVETNVRTWESLCHPDDLALIHGAVHKFFEEPQGKGFEIEHRMRAKDGSWRWIVSRGNVVERDATGKPLRIAGANADINERKQAEERLRQMERQVRQAQKMTPSDGWQAEWRMTSTICSPSSRAIPNWPWRNCARIIPFARN